MKKLIYISLLALFLTGCSKLDLIPISSKSTEGFYKTEAHINQGIVGIYTGLRSAWVSAQSSYMLTEARSDNAFQGQAYNDGPISRFEETAELPILYTAWSQYFSYIHRTNTLLEALPAVGSIESNQSKQYEAEAKFLRAMFFFDLVRIFGGVPLVDKTLSIEESYSMKRATVKEVYDFIISDLTFAAEFLPESHSDSNKGRATRWAAKGYLGKVFLFTSGYPLKENNWDKARTAFKEIIDSKKFEFFANYADIYNHNFEGGKQQIFSISFKSGASGNGNPFPTRNASNDIAPLPIDQGGLPFGGSPFNLFLSNDILGAYEEGDLRKEASILSTWKHKSGQMISTLPTTKKYQNGPVSAANDWDIDWIALSYTDILLMYAECLNEIGYQGNGEAIQILNNVRQRAGLLPKGSTDIPNQSAFRLALEQERRIEFAFENLRWFDLVRTDRALDVMQKYLTSYGISSNLKGREQYIYPIPQTVRHVTPGIEQNQGYD